MGKLRSDMPHAMHRRDPKMTTASDAVDESTTGGYMDADGSTTNSTRFYRRDDICMSLL